MKDRLFLGITEQKLTKRIHLFKECDFLPDLEVSFLCVFFILISSCVSSCPQVPPLTPSTNKKVGEVLKTTYATWEKDAERLCIPRDPRMWTPDHVGHWLSWAIREFSLAGPNFTQFVQQFQVRKVDSKSFSVFFCYNFFLI